MSHPSARGEIMTYILYGEPGSGSFTPEALLAEAGAEVEKKWLDLSRDEQLDENYKRVNPMGRVPTLILPDGTIMTESAAIILTIAERHPEAELLPPPASRERALAYRWMMFIASNIYEAVSREDYPARFTTDPAGADGIKEAATMELRRLWTLLDRTLNPSPYAIGDRFTALDVYIANLSRWIVGAEWRAEHCPRLDRLAEAVAQRPKIAPIWRAHFG
ncbi:glutathione S-transferase family protein [Inquilinus sp. CAU 1745]|uniref:glutathione S-transferase family protein n=1 Tax=Inquilinus sp. CAU 1745 TaxID=3140369 RepID=UPI00325BDA12